MGKHERAVQAVKDAQAGITGMARMMSQEIPQCAIDLNIALQILDEHKPDPEYVKILRELRTG